jgi:hypothetical protein
LKNVTAATNPSPYWLALARSYSTLGQPLRPSPDDIGFMERATAELAAREPTRPLRALLLGVTPAVADMRWPTRSSLLAVDSSAAMVKAVWPGNVPQRRWAVCGNWLSLPLRRGSFQVVIGDGSLNCLHYPEGYCALAKVLSGVLCDEGALVLRCYVQPEEREAPEQIVADALSGEIPTFHHFKFRLLMALQPSARQGVPVKEVYNVWTQRRLGQRLTNCRAGWTKQDTDMIQLYRDSPTVHTFPTLAESSDVLRRFFEEVSVFTPSYYNGDRCLTLVMRRRGRRSLASGTARTAP